jgi:choline dehydrogenase-like flavoprotein
MSDQPESYDYIVVGAGSAGAIVAARLSEDPGTSVLLIEAGPEDRNLWSRVPLGFGKIIFDRDYMWWNHTTEPEPGLNDKQYPLPHGKVVGGSSAINGLVHVRGTRLDYDTWKERGADGWGYDDVLPYFKKHERHHLGATEYHGADGPLGIELARWKNPLADAFLETAADNLGLPRNDDFSGADAAGAGYWDLATWNGRRSSTSLGYIACPDHLARSARQPLVRLQPPHRGGGCPHAHGRHEAGRADRRGDAQGFRRPGDRARSGRRQRRGAARLHEGERGYRVPLLRHRSHRQRRHGRRRP